MTSSRPTRTSRLALAALAVLAAVALPFAQGAPQRPATYPRCV